jgi:hypothetical protein
MRMIVEKVVENGFTSMDAQGTSAMLHAHARGFGVMMNVDPTNMSDDTKVCNADSLKQSYCEAFSDTGQTAARTGSSSLQGSPCRRTPARTPAREVPRPLR